MQHVKSRIVAGLAALALAGGATAAVATAGNAATTGCSATGLTCAALASQKYGTGDVSAVSSGAATQGQPVFLATSGAFSTEDFILLNVSTVASIMNNGTVASICTNIPGLLSSEICDTWPSYDVYEYEYAPDGDQTGLCLGTSETAVNGAQVSLQTCGVDSDTLWIPLGIDEIGGFEPLIAGSDTVVNTPYVLKAGTKVGDQLTTHKLDLVDGTFNPAEMWQNETGVL